MVDFVEQQIWYLITFYGLRTISVYKTVMPNPFTTNSMSLSFQNIEQCNPVNSMAKDVWTLGWVPDSFEVKLD